MRRLDDSSKQGPKIELVYEHDPASAKPITVARVGDFSVSTRDFDKFGERARVESQKIVEVVNLCVPRLDRVDGRMLIDR